MIALQHARPAGDLQNGGLRFLLSCAEARPSRRPACGSVGLRLTSAGVAIGERCAHGVDRNPRYEAREVGGTPSGPAISAWQFTFGIASQRSRASQRSMCSELDTPLASGLAAFGVHSDQSAFL
jgi:hypothetical protein